MRSGGESTVEAEDVPAPSGTLPLVLASRSPRRGQLLGEHGLRHEAFHPGFDDALLTPGRVGPAQWVAALAYLKAWGWAVGEGAALVAAGPRLVLGADTACVLDGRLIGTPRDAAEAGAMIRAFMGREHEVVTGVALLDTRELTLGRVPMAREIFADRATVRMGRVGEGEIGAYLAGGGGAGKAGGYNLRDRIEAGWPVEFEGDATAVMGLPMEALLRRLGRAGWGVARAQ